MSGTRLSLLLGCGAVAALAATRLLQTRRALRALDRLHGRTVLITGGARGLGLLLAKEFGRWGALVFVTSRTQADVDRAVEELRGVGCEATGLVADIRTPEAVEALIQQVVAATGRIDVLVNNAGIIQATPIEHARVEDFDDSLRTHFWAPLHAIRAVLPHMQRAGQGRIVNIASIGGRIAVPHLVPYSVGKFALVGLSQGLCAELRKDGIAVTTVCPGLMRTGSHVRARLRGQHEREARWFGLSVATPITSMSAERAARRIVRATVERRARIVLGWQARVAEIVDTLAPELAAHLSSAATRAILPGPGEDADGERVRVAGEVGFGWIEPFLPGEAQASAPESE